MFKVTERKRAENTKLMKQLPWTEMKREMDQFSSV